MELGSAVFVENLRPRFVFRAQWLPARDEAPVRINFRLIVNPDIPTVLGKQRVFSLQTALGDILAKGFRDLKTHFWSGDVIDGHVKQCVARITQKSANAVSDFEVSSIGVHKHDVRAVDFGMRVADPDWS